LINKRLKFIKHIMINQNRLKIFSLQENLKQGLALVGHVSGKNVNLPILNNILIKAEQGKIKLIATNLEIGVISTVRGKIEREGLFTVSSKIISDCINLLPNKKIGLKQKENFLLVDCENFQAKIKGQSAEEFPLIPEIDRKNYFSANPEEVKKAISQVIFAAAASETRLELSGVLLVFSENNLTIAATDSYRLAEKKIKIKSNNKEEKEEKEEKRIIVPAKTLHELLRILSVTLDDGIEEKNSEIQFYISENQILFIYGSTELVSRLIEGQYPDYQQIIPVASKTKISIDRQELIRAVKIASLFSKAGINDVNLDFLEGKNQVIISSVSGQTGENITKLEAGVLGNDNSIVVNYRYLLEGLSNIEKEIIKIEVIDSNTPCIIKPEQDEGYLYIIMPIKQ
ncbi:DNA polymerase III subunit beta, partial [Patescibacteria group bacterium]|nr:DNA polymerase III subunit beta [Patescibacteria group bacterium]